MNILILTANPVDTAGGVERFCYNLVEICRDKGWRVQLLTPHDLAGRAVALNAVTELVWAYRLGRAISRFLRNVDLVISNGIWGSWVDDRVTRINVYHGTWAGNYIAGQWRSPKKWVGRQIRTWLERRSGKNAVNIAVSENVKKEVEQYYGLEVACVIENGVDLQRFYPPSEDERRAKKLQLGFASHSVVALYVGRMEWMKGIDRVNELASRIKKSDLGSFIEFCVVTPKVERRFFCPNIKYIVGDDMQRVLQAYRAADVLFFPSRYESWGFVVFEALATGLPVIGTPTGAMRVIKERDAVLGKYITDDDSVEALQMKLQSYLSLSQEEKADLSRRARRYAEKWASLELFRRKWLTLIGEVGNHGKR